MTKGEYILKNEPIAVHDYYRIQIHKIKDGYVYLSRLYQPTYCGATKVSFHKVKLRESQHGYQYIELMEKTYDGKRRHLSLNLNNFIFKDSGYCISCISCKELEAIC